MFKKLAISKRLALGILVPLIGLTIVGSVGTYGAYKKYANAAILTYLSEAVNELAALTDTLQVERGQSAIMIGSGAAQPSSALVAARQTTDIEVKKLHKVNIHVHETGDPELIQGLDAMEEELKGLQSMRAAINAGSVPLGEAMKYYSVTIKHILDLSHLTAKKATNAELALETVAMLELAGAKEFAGQERGLVAGLIASNAVTQDQLYKLERSIGKQETMIESFLVNQPLIHEQKFRTLVDGIRTEEVNDIRHEIEELAKGNIESLSVTAPQWFAAATKRISDMRDIEIKAIDIITESSIIYKSQYWTQTLVTAFVSLVTLFGAIIVGYFISRSIKQDIALTTSEMAFLAQGDASITVTRVGDNTELGKMADALKVFQDNAREKERLEAEAAIEREKAKETRLAGEKAREQRTKEVETVVNSLGNALQRLADGNLAQGISTEYAEEFSQLKNDFMNSIEKLSSVMKDINETTGEISTNTTELRGAADDLAKRTEQQAAALEETSAALEEITATVKESADRATEASSKAAVAKTSTEKSGTVVKDAVDAMERIEKASDEISQIISVIDDIAFQTNLLALNAGVEAARAGEAGKGFAVVAQEVRELAQRSADAAKEIKELITNSGDEVSNGVSLVKATGEALEQIDSQVSEIDEHIQSIARATSEQSEGLTEVNRAVNEMDQVTQQNAAMVEETNAVVHNLSEDANMLSMLVNQFDIDGSMKSGTKSSASATPAAKPAAAPTKAPAAATQDDQPVQSPARAMVQKVANGMGGAAAAQTEDESWDEF